MCDIVKFTRGVIFGGSCLVTVFGVVLLVVTVIYNLQKTPLDGLPKAKSVAFGLFYTISVLTIVFGLCGVIGTLRKHRGMLCLYSFQSTVVCLMSLGLGISAFVFLPSVFKGSTCSSSSSLSNSFIPKFNDLYLASYQYYGTAACPALSPDYPQGYSPSQEQALQALPLAIVTRAQPNAFSNAINNCTRIPDTFYASGLMVVERTLKCSGMCLAPAVPAARGYYYSFSDIGQGLPSQSCYLAMIGFADGLSARIGGTAFAIFAAFLINQVLIFFVCCRTRDTNQDIKTNVKEFDFGY
jgi:hypothetical protein